MLNGLTKRAVCAVTALAMGAGAAVAADSPQPAPPPIEASPAEVYERVADWTGPYIGVHGVWGQARVDGAGDENKISDFGGGGQIGYNYQFSPNFVAGVEADYTFIEETGTYTAPGGATYTNTLDGLGSARLRAGVALDRVLLYGTGGVAFGEVTSSATPSGVRDETNWGWVAGAGIEGLVTENVTARGEYLYYDLGEVNTPGASDVNVHAVRLGLNYKFNTK